MRMALTNRYVVWFLYLARMMYPIQVYMNIPRDIESGVKITMQKFM